MEDTNQIMPDIYGELSYLREMFNKSEHDEIEKKLKNFYEFLKSERILSIFNIYYS